MKLFFLMPWLVSLEKKGCLEIEASEAEWKDDGIRIWARSQRNVASFSILL